MLSRGLWTLKEVIYALKWPASSFLDEELDSRL